MHPKFAHLSRIQSTTVTPHLLRGLEKTGCRNKCGVTYFSLTAALLTGIAPAFSAVTAPQIVISATRTPTPLSKIASSVTVISQEQMAAGNKTTVVELLRDVPGVTVAQNAGPGQTAYVFMRGTNSSHVLVLMDGVALNDPSDPSDAYDFSNLLTDNIDHIEILRGPQSTLYGSQAIGGVISIVTKKGSGAPSYGGFVEGGSYATRKEGVHASGSVGRTSYSVGASEGHTGGFSAFDKYYGGVDRDGSESYNFNGNVQTKITDNFTAKLSAHYSRIDSEIDLFGADTPYAGTDTRQFNGRVAGELTLWDGRWTQELGLSNLYVNRSSKEDYYGYTHYFGGRNTLDWVHHIKAAPDHLVTLGLETWREYYKTNSQAQTDVENRAAYIQDQYDITDALFVTYGGRIDDHQTFGSQATWKVAPGYRIKSTGTTLKATYGTGFKAPSLYQLFDPLSGNTGLKPERSKGYDIGFEQAVLGNKLTFGSSYFENKISNLFSFKNFYPFQSINVGRARTRGFETTVKWMPTTDWTISASHTYTLADDLTNDRQLLRRPKQQANVTATYQYNERGDVTASLRMEGIRKDIDLAYSYADLKGFTTLDVSTNYKLNPKVTLYGRVDNVLDKRHEEIYGYGTSGLAAYAGVKFGF